MKKTRVTITAIILAVIINAVSVISGTTTVFAAANMKKDNITILLDGEPIEFDVPPFIENGCTFVPFRAIFEAFELYVSYSEQTRVIYATMQTTRNSLQYWVDLSEKTIVCEGVECDPDTMVESTIAAGKMQAKKTGSVVFQKSIELRSVNGRTFVHARLIAESLGCKVEWDGAARTVVIISENAEIVSEQHDNLPARVKLDRSGIAEAKSARYKATEDELVKLLNEAQIRKGQSALKQDERLTRIARIKAQTLAKDGYEAYRDIDLKKMFNESIGQITSYSCNFVSDKNTSDEVIQIWQNAVGFPLIESTLIGVGGAMDTSGRFHWVYVSVAPFGDAEKTTLEDEVLRLINDERTKNGLSPVVKNADLAKVARIKAQDNVDNNNLSHKSVTYGYPDQMFNDITGISVCIGENLAVGVEPYNIFKAWMDSPGHKAHMLDPKIIEAGVGIALMEDGKLYCSFMSIGNNYGW